MPLNIDEIALKLETYRHRDIIVAEEMPPEGVVKRILKSMEDPGVEWAKAWKTAYREFHEHYDPIMTDNRELANSIWNKVGNPAERHIYFNFWDRVEKQLSKKHQDSIDFQLYDLGYSVASFAIQRFTGMDFHQPYFELFTLGVIPIEIEGTFYVIGDSGMILGCLKDLAANNNHLNLTEDN